MADKIRYHAHRNHAHCSHCGEPVPRAKDGSLDLGWGLCKDCRHYIGKEEARKGAKTR